MAMNWWKRVGLAGEVGVWVTVALLGASASAYAQAPAADSPAAAPAVDTSKATSTSPSYVLGPDDVIAIKAMDAEEINSATLRVDSNGFISLPLLGRVPAGGASVEALEKEIATRLKKYVRSPVVAVNVVEYRSQPVSVVGSVNQSGVLQLEGRKTLVEMLAKAGGVRPDAGNTIKIMRRQEWGPIPLPNATLGPTGEYSVAEVSLQSITQATNPEHNILIKPHDVISVPKADIVYVIGEVKKPGGFALSERSSVSGVRALAMADGLTSVAAAHKAAIIRQPPGQKPIQIPVNLKEILKGKQPDVEVLPDDILFIPTNVARNAVTKTLSTAIQAASSALIYHAY